MLETQFHTAMMAKRIIFPVLIALLTTFRILVPAQVPDQIAPQSASETAIPLSGVVELQTSDRDWFPYLKNTRKSAVAPAPSASEQSISAPLQRNLPDTNLEEPVIRIKTVPPPPVSGIGFQANSMDGIPNDNNIAMNEYGDIVSVSNSQIVVYNSFGTLKAQMSLDAFAWPFMAQSFKFDPHVIYDTRNHRFVVCFISGRAPSNSKLVVAFSRTSDPTNEWNLYEFNGNILGNSVLDYPQIGITEEELFITANIVDSAGLNTYGSAIWQARLADGYNALPLSNQLFQSNYTGLLPVSGATSPKGPELYFLSAIAIPSSPSQTILVHKITNTISNGGLLDLPVTLLGTHSYLTPPYANQKGTAIQLNTNDCRVLDAYFEGDRIEFVMNSSRNAVSAVYYGSILIPSTGLANATIETRPVWSDSAAIAYPSIAFGGCTDPTNGKHSSVIGVNFSSNTLYPGSGAFYIDENYAVSEMARGKTGTTYIGTVFSNPWRWGDYTSTIIHPNNPGEVWTVGSFGTGPNTHQSGTWINQYFTPCYIQTGTEIQPNAQPEIAIYPNPTPEWFEVKFETPESGNYALEICNVDGSISQTIVKDYLAKGEAVFKCSVSQLAQGTYFLNIRMNGNVVSTRKFVVAR